METFSALLALCAGNSPVTGEFPSQRPVTRSFDVFFDLGLNKGLSTQSGADNFRRRRAHYDVTVMFTDTLPQVSYSHLIEKIGFQDNDHFNDPPRSQFY